MCFNDFLKTTSNGWTRLVHPGGILIKILLYLSAVRGVQLQ